jgi:hypothetical protein|tara:strand:- start:82 stop:606 length:525 start_codon:yes stop_codon:yes gene_type:complete
MDIVINPNVQQATIAISAVNVQPGALPNGTTESLMELKYAYANFTQPGIDSFKEGDLVCFEPTVSQEYPYGCVLKKANTTDLALAPRMLMLFISWRNGTLIVMHKGYFDYQDIPESQLANWAPGATIYASNQGLDIEPNNEPNNWVKSIGFCFPNLEGKRRVWFESDSTYLVVG